MRPFPILRPSSALILAGLYFSLTSCAAESSPGQPLQFGQDTLCIKTATQTVVIPVEVASTPQQRAFGLMERTWLREDGGMLFLYPAPQPANHGLWMYRTRIPLDAAFIGEDGTILRIRSMQPCTSPRGDCPVYEAGVEYTMALEVNWGFFEARGIKAGDSVMNLDAACPP